jgi:hypothetical protein
MAKKGRWFSGLLSEKKKEWEMGRRREEGERLGFQEPRGGD